jgi:hypothetical protein
MTAVALQTRAAALPKVKGGKTILKRLAEVDANLEAQRAYWHPRSRMQTP